MRVPPNHLIPATALSEAVLAEAAERFSTPLYVTDAGRLATDLGLLREALPEGVEVLYSAKANPSLAVLGEFSGLGLGIEICSPGELMALKAVDADPSRAIYVGPGKGEAELREGIASGIGLLVAESALELERIERAAASLSTGCRALLRVNPGFGHGDQHMGGATQFGVDLSQAAQILDSRDRFERVELVGVHAYAGTRVMEAGSLLENFAGVLQIAESLQVSTGAVFDTVDLGGGFGVPLYDGERDIDAARLREGLGALLADYSRRHPATRRLLVESGRFLAARSSVYLTRVVDVKMVGSKRFAIVDGGIHAIGGRDGYLGARVSPMRLLGRGEEPGVEVTVCGPLCTPADRIAARISLPAPRPGDLLAVYVAGAYGSTASAGFFLSRGFPAEATLRGGELTLTRRAIGPAALIEAQSGQTKGAQ